MVFEEKEMLQNTLVERGKGKKRMDIELCYL